MTFSRLFSWALIGSIAAADVGGGICGVSWGAQRLDVFGYDSKDDAFHKYYTAFGWGPDDSAHGNLELFADANVATPVSVTSWGANRLDFAFVDKNGNAKHKYWDGTSWGPSNGFDQLGKGVEGKLALNSWGENRFDVVALGLGRAYVHKAWTGSDYYPPGDAWEDFGGDFLSPPATVSWGANRLDIFGITMQGNISHKWWDGYQWNPAGQAWEDLGGKGFTGIPVASSPYNGRFDVWAVSKDSGELWHLFWDGYNYHSWESLGGKFENAPQVTHWSANRVDLLGKSAGKKSNYEYKYWDGYQWNGWYSKGGPFDSEPALVNIGENNLNLFGVDKDGKLKLQVWDGSQWLPDAQGWYELGKTDVDAKRLVAHPQPGPIEKVFSEKEQKLRIQLKFRA